MLVLFMLACSYVRGDLGFKIGEKIILKSNDQWLLVVHSEEKIQKDDSYASTVYDTYSSETSTDDANEDICADYRSTLSIIDYEQGNNSYNLSSISIGPRNDSLYSLNVSSKDTVFLWQLDDSHGYERFIPIYDGKSKDIEIKEHENTMLVRGTSGDALEFKVTAPICEIYF